MKKIPNEFKGRGPTRDFTYRLAERIKKGKTEYAIYSLYAFGNFQGVELHQIGVYKHNRIIAGVTVNNKGDEYLAGTSSFGDYAQYFKFTGHNVPELEAKARIEELNETVTKWTDKTKAIV